MPTRQIGTLVACLTTLLVLAGPASTHAQVPLQPRRISYKHLTDLAHASYGIKRLRDNAHMYLEAIQEARKTATGLEGTELVFEVTVKQVTMSEVLINTQTAGGAQVHVLPSPEDHVPYSYHTRHRVFPGPPSTQLYNILSAPQTLLIGRDIQLEDAKRLRKGDVLTLVATVQAIKAQIPAQFLDDTVVFLANARVYYEDENWLQQRGLQ